MCFASRALVCRHDRAHTHEPLMHPAAFHIMQLLEYFFILFPTYYRTCESIAKRPFHCERSEKLSYYLDMSPGSVDVFLLVRVLWFSPLWADAKRDQSLLLGAVCWVVEMPNFCMSLDEIVPHDVRGSTWSERDPLEDRDIGGGLHCSTKLQLLYTMGGSKCTVQTYYTTFPLVYCTY